MLNVPQRHTREGRSARFTAAQEAAVAAGWAWLAAARMERAKAHHLDSTPPRRCHSRQTRQGRGGTAQGFVERFVF
ncbi:hypothetical protein E2C01_087929 [Portunus trituberculatus]|uniref:Uncharacterized protein n=1 Tax=Portunus trituberculatus TaxID=210409 RepID=A0A5B7J7W5_PORTR|nr:hypothetical protein [Portunus trituberculatus]